MSETCKRLLMTWGNPVCGRPGNPCRMHRAGDERKAKNRARWQAKWAEEERHRRAEREHEKASDVFIAAYDAWAAVSESHPHNARLLVAMHAARERLRRAEKELQ